MDKLSIPSLLPSPVPRKVVLDQGSGGCPLPTPRSRVLETYCPPPPPQVFYWTHLSYLPMWVLLILHGPNFWKWLLVPGLLFFLEKATGLVVSRMAALCIVEVNLLPSKV